MSDRPVVPSGATRVACVVGDPIAHSRSPAIHNAAFRALGLDWIYTAFRTIEGAGAVDAMRVLHISGMSVTMPCKEGAAAACDELSPTAHALGSANALVLREDGSVFGDSTDGPGLLAALDEGSVEVSGRRVLVLGAGGAARAASHALQEAGARVTVAARRSDAAERTARGGAATVPWSELDAAVATSDVIVNATPLGMHGESPPFGVEAFHTGHVVVDLVYEPLYTPMLAAASAAGARTVTGLGMLVHQAAAAFELWTGEAAPLAEMHEAAAVGG